MYERTHSPVASQVTNCQKRVTLVRHSDFVIRSDKPPILNGTNRRERMVVDQVKNTICSFDQGRAALVPVAAVVIRHVAELADGRAMDVAAENGVDVVTFGVVRHSSFEFANEADRVFHTPLGICAEGPVAETEAAPDEINERIEREQKLITNVTGKREPLHPAAAGHHHIEFVAVND